MATEGNYHQKSGCKDAAAVQDNRCTGRRASIAIKQERMPALSLTKPSIPLWVESQENVFKICAAGVFPVQRRLVVDLLVICGRSAKTLNQPRFS